MNVKFDFQSKKVIVTGAAGIFGAWICESFAAAGAALWLVGRNEANLQKLAGRLKNEIDPGLEIQITAADIKEEAQIHALRDQVAAAWGAPDYVINNAGIYPSALMLEITTEQWDSVMDLNVRGSFLMTQNFARQMIAAGKGGAFVNIISRSAKMPRVGAVHYATSKAALEMMTRGHAMELAPYGIRVNAVSPGFAPGSELSHLSEEYITNMCKKIPLGRTSGPDDAPNAVLYLCSEAADFITGTSLYVDGGNTAGDFLLPVMDDRKA